MMALLLLGCAGEAAWVVQHGSIVPGESGMEGTQTWEFFDASWSPDAGDQGYLCARSQTVVGTLSGSTACPSCRAVWALQVEELGTDCPDDLAQSEDFGGPALYALGDVAEALLPDAPWPGEGFGWSVGFADGELVDVGYAYAEALDAGDAAPPGLALGEVYTLWPGAAWQR